jgi:Carboxypeptidase regulatory-like domain
MSKKWMGPLILLIGVVLLPASLRAQVPKVSRKAPGGMVGEVVNAKGAPVAGALILWQVADGEKPHVLHSDAHGHFRIASLRSGLYDVRASAGSASSEWSRNVLVKPGADTSLTLRIAPATPHNTASRGSGNSIQPGY